MKKLKFLLLVGAILMLAAASFAQTGPTNLMGLSAQRGWADWCVFGPGMQVYSAYLYVQDPVNPDFQGGSRPVAWINGFECRLWIEGDATVLGWTFPVNAIDAGTNGNTVVGFAEPVPVTDGRAVLATVDLFLGFGTSGVVGSDKSPLPCDQPTALVHMAPTRPTSSIEGMMSFLDADDPDDPLVGAYLDFLNAEDVALLLEAEVVGVETHAWGGIKALYR